MGARKTKGGSPVGTVAILGAGAVATAFARRLVKEQIPVVLWARSRSRARSLHRKVGFGARQGHAQWARELRDLDDVDSFVIAVSDRSIAEVADELAFEVPKRRRKRVALHTSGYFDESLLTPLREEGWSTGTLHPLTALPKRGTSGELSSGTWFATSGDVTARRLARNLARALGGRELALREGGDKHAYHAAAALLAGGLVALFDAAEETLADSVATGEVWREAFCDLARSVIHNVEMQGPTQALTGPAVRGDNEVIAGHHRVFAKQKEKGRAKEARNGALYRALSERMLEMAQARGALTPEQRQEIEALLVR